MDDQSRREFLGKLAALTGGVVLLPTVTSCGGASAASSGIRDLLSMKTPVITGI